MRCQKHPELGLIDYSYYLDGTERIHYCPLCWEGKTLPRSNKSKFFLEKSAEERQEIIQANPIDDDND